ncbi:Nuclear pore complex protein Nup98-Nup96 [Halotydeus destructor]|nr:Nuclear pore complex protein Nup98-Nup96 [Halotydeus destructor]
MFGQSKPLFGAAAPTASVFGTPSTSAFGAPAAPAFGAPQQAPTLFGSPQVNTFGSPATGSTGLFGQQQPQQQQSLFGGTPAPAAGGFGSAFGKPAAPSIFGAPAAAAQPTGLFGSPAQGFGSQAPAFGVQATPVGTTVKFNPPAGTDTMMKNGVSQSISTRHQCITAMKEYETKSLDELRMEDYSAGRKTGAPAQFGTPAQPSGMFGSTSTATPAFGASTGTGLFGQNKPVFGASTTTATSTGLFGGTSAFNKPFGAPTTAFGTAQPVMQPTGGLFGNTSTAPAFGAQTQTPSLFGQNTAAAKPFSFATPSPATTQTSLFGNTGFNAQPANQPKPLFGTTPAPAFGTVTSTAFPAFGNTTTTTSSLFGATSQPSLFSNPTSKPFTGFGTQAPAFGTASTPSLIGGTQQTSLFGNTGASNAFGTQQPSLFGSTTAGTGLFGTSNFAPAAQPLSGFSTSFTGFGQPAQQTTMNAAVNNTSSNINEMLLARLQTLPYGNSTLFENDLLSSVSISSSLKLPSDVKSLNQFSMGSKQATVKRVPSTRSNSLLFDGMEEEDPKEKLAAIDIFKPRRNFKKLELKPKQVEETTPKELSKVIASPSLEIREAPRILATGRSPEADNTILEFARRPRQAETSVSTPLTTKGRSREFSVSPASFQDLGDESSLNLPSNTSLHLKCGLRSSRPDYYTIPPLETIDSYLDPETGDCFVDGFTIGRRGYGSIFWEGKINVRDLNLDEIVHIRRKEVIVYPDDENKSPEGKGLNRPAQVTLDQVWPVDKSTREIIKDVPRLERMRYAEKVEAADC